MNKLRLWWKYDARYFHKEFIQGVKNLIKWFPVIWKDRNWDHRFIFDILKFKLQNQANYIGKYGIHVDADKDAELLMKCVNLIDKVSTEFYPTEVIDYYENRYYLEDIPEDERTEHYEEGMQYWKSEIISERFDEYFAKYPEIYQYVQKHKKGQPFKGKDKHAIAMNMGYELHKRARKELFDILEKNIETWWD